MALGTEQIKGIFDIWASTYDQTVVMGEWGFEYYDDGLEWIGKQLGHLVLYDRVIDLGCGTGVLAEKLLRNHPLVEYIGVDISREMLRIAKTRVLSARFLQADLRDFGVWDRYLEADHRCSIVSTYALHHVTDEDKVRVIKHAFSASKRQDFKFLIVDYAFRDRSDREHKFREQMNRANDHVVEEITSEYYANLSVIN